MVNILYSCNYLKKGIKPIKDEIISGKEQKQRRRVKKEQDEECSVRLSIYTITVCTGYSGYSKYCRGN